MKACCLIGHREICNHEKEAVIQHLRREIIMAIDEGFSQFLCGATIGFDQLASMEILSLKNIYPAIQLNLVLPYRSQQIYWNLSDQQIYNHILKQADCVNYRREKYKDGCILKRNRAVIDMSSRCIVYLRHRLGDTVATIKYATEQNVPLVII